MIIIGKWSSEYAPRAAKHSPNKRIRRSEVPDPAYVLWEVRPKFEKGNDCPIAKWPPFHRGEPRSSSLLRQFWPRKNDQ